MAIRTFRSKALQRLFDRGAERRIPPDQARKIVLLLDHLDAATNKSDLNVSGFHQLKGDGKGTCAWKVTANWRLTFRFESGDAFDLDLEDYH
jgi:proteic killer suppression protein